jgi:hypothetical protein
LRSKRMDIVHIACMQAHTCHHWKHIACLHYNRRQSKRDITAGIIRRGHTVTPCPGQRSRNRIGVCDGAWIRAGAGWADGDGTRRADGMRGDGVGLRDVGAMHDGRTWVARHRCYCDDCRGAGREHDGGVLDGRGQLELGITEQQCRDWISVSDGAWIRAGAGGIHGDGKDGADGMRGDGVGVGDVSAVQCRQATRGKSKCLSHAWVFWRIDEYGIQFRSCIFVFRSLD